MTPSIISTLFSSIVTPTYFFTSSVISTSTISNDYIYSSSLNTTGTSSETSSYNNTSLTSVETTTSFGTRQTSSYNNTSLTSVETSTSFSTIQTSSYNNASSGPTTTEPPTLVPALPAALVPVICIIILIFLVFLYLRSKRKNPENSGFKSIISKPIDIVEFESALRDMNANSQLKFSEEFSTLSTVGNEYSKDVSGQEGNREKNRYTDIKPYDISRVKLSINPEDESDYINASWIPGYFSRRQYIAAQGPMPSTQDDFWRMIWEYNSKIIVMLTKTSENNRIKCCQYWPSGSEVVMYGDIAVNIVKEIEADSWIIREMNVSMGQQKRNVKQCFFSKWPDMKTPEESSSIIEFIKMIRSYCPIRGSSPIVVHCSAGVGRTGAFIAIDTSLYQIEEEEKVDIFGIVYKMRLSRVSMVQNERQYIFIYDTVGEIIRNYLEEKENKKIDYGYKQWKKDFFFEDLPKSDSIPDTLAFHYDMSNGALISNDDNKSLL